MKLIIDFRDTYINDRSLRRFTYEFWEDITYLQPDHEFIVISDEETALWQSANMQTRQLKKTGFAWLDKIRFKKMLKSVRADRLLTVQPAGFTITRLLYASGTNVTASTPKQVWFEGSEKALLPASGTSVIQPAHRNIITALSWTESESIKTQYTGGRSFFLFTGDISEQHRLIELLKAFSAFKKWQQSNMQLVIAGRSTGWTAVLDEKLASYKYRQDVAVLKNISNAEIAKLTAACYALVYPVPANVFPLALLWAIECNKAIITTDNTTTRAFTSAAAWVDENDTEDGFAKAMILLYKDEARQQQLVLQTREAANRFNRQQMLATAWEHIK